jgi:hypothetical protein
MGKNLQGGGRRTTGYYRGVCLWGLRKNTEAFRIAGDPAEIRTEHLSNTSLDRPFYSSLFGALHVTASTPKQQLTNFAEPSPSSEADSSAATQELP